MSTTSLTLDQLPGAIPVAAQTAIIGPKDVAFPGEERSDESILAEVNQNLALSVGFMQSRGLESSWNIAEILLRCYVKKEKWKGSEQYRSHLGLPILAEQFFSLLSAIQQAIFTGVSFFEVESTQGTEMDVARAQQGLCEWAVKNCGPFGGSLKAEFRLMAYDAFLYGLGIGFMGWRKIKKTVVTKQYKNPPVSVGAGMGNVSIAQGDPDELIDVPTEVEINQPVFEHVPLRRFRCAPDCRRSEARSATWAARILYLTPYQLEELRDTEGFNIPTKEQLIALNAPQKLTGTEQNPLDYQGGTAASTISSVIDNTKAYPEALDQKSNVDPLSNKWEVIDYWSASRHYMVMEKQYVLLKEEHDQETNPFLTFNFRESPDSIHGFGLGHLLGDFQRIACGVANAFFDDLTLNLMGVYARPRGLNTSAQSDFLWPGKVFQFDAPSGGGAGGGFQALARNGTGVDILGVISEVKAWAASLTGIGAGMQGSNPGKSGDFRTGQGVNLLASGEATKSQDLVDQICDLVLVPFLKHVIAQNKKLKPSQIKQILSKELDKAWTGDPLSVINADYKVTIAAGTRLAAANALQSRLGFIVQILQSPGMTQQLETQGKKVLYDNLMKNILDSTGYSYEELIADMTDEDKQRVAAQSQQAAAQSKMALQQGATQSKISVNENQAENRALLKQQEHMYQQSDKEVMAST
jgi:hypothetical protein